MTNQKKRKLAREIRDFLDAHYVNGDCRIYFCGICWEHGEEDTPFTWENHTFVDVPTRTGWRVIEGVSPKSFFNWASGDVCMSFEGGFYDVMNPGSSEDVRLNNEFEALLQRNGCYCELGNTWNLSIYDD